MLSSNLMIDKAIAVFLEYIVVELFHKEVDILVSKQEKSEDIVNYVPFLLCQYHIKKLVSHLDVLTDFFDFD